MFLVGNNSYNNLNIIYKKGFKLILKANPNNFLSKLPCAFLIVMFVFALFHFFPQSVSAEEASPPGVIAAPSEQPIKQVSNTAEQPSEQAAVPEQSSKQDANTSSQPSGQVALPVGQPPEQGVNPIAQPQEQTAIIPSVQKKPAISRGSVVLNFDDADVYEVIQTIFGQVLKVNYIVDPRVKGRVTFRSIAPVAQNNVLPLMEVILRLNGIAVVEESGLYRIVLINDISKELSDVQIGRDSNSVSLEGKALLQVVPVRYMQSSDLVELLKPFLSENAAIIDVPMSNQIIIADTDANVKRLLKLVEIFDNELQRKKGPQVFVYPVQNGKAKDIEIQLQQIFLGEKAASKEKGVTVSSSQTKKTTETTKQVSIKSGDGKEALVSGITRIYSDETLNAIIILSTPEDYEIIKDAIAKIDLVPRQVMIEGMIAQIDLKDDLSLGLAWAINTKNFGGSPANITFNANGLTSATSSTGLRFIGTDSGDAVRAVVTALESQSRGKLLAAPHILVSDNREATIQVGQQVPIVTSSTLATSTQAAQQTIQYKDIGIILKVKPQVNDSGLVSLEIKQEVSSFSSLSSADTVTSNEDILINKTEVSTNLVVQDGHTIIIGGLIREDKSKSRTGIPWLVKIPILGFLFGGTNDTNKRTELIILLTPHVVKNQNEAKSLTSGIVDKFVEEGKGGINKQELMKNIGAGKNSVGKKGIEPIK